jgi:hypothetical protein
MSAFLAGDLLNGTIAQPSFQAFSGHFVASGNLNQVGLSVDMNNANTFCNVLICGTANTTSGQLRVAVQCADADVSGQYTDPTSGLAQMPTIFESGGIVRLNSGGLLGGTYQGTISQGPGANPGTAQGVVFSASGAPQSGYAIQSGFCVFAGFQRPQRFVRATIVSGDFYDGPLFIGFVSQLRSTGSGGGFSFFPSSGAVNV